MLGRRRMAASSVDFDEVPVVDVSSIADLDLEGSNAPSAAQTAAAEALGDAFKRAGFAYVRGYESALPADLEARLDDESREFFRLPLEEKMKIHMSGSGRAWRGYFPCGEELTSGRPDIKEGLYLGQELGEDDPRVAAGLPVHGRNLFPERPAGLRAAVLDYMAAAEQLGQKLMALVALSLGLPASFFVRGCTHSPLCLFRAFHYPPPATLGPAFQDPDLWGVGEHTDYGLLTLLKQDVVGGLQLKNRRNEWVPAPYVPGTLVINIGDMLEAMTHGLYRSTPHRVRNPSPTAMRVTYPFFFDPGYNAEISPLPLSEELAAQASAARAARAAAGDSRWDGASPLDVSGTYGRYLLGKIAKVFPELAAAAALSDK